MDPSKLQKKLGETLNSMMNKLKNTSKVNLKKKVVQILLYGQNRYSCNVILMPRRMVMAMMNKDGADVMMLKKRS
jgi:hypothetical protein